MEQTKLSWLYGIFCNYFLNPWIPAVVIVEVWNEPSFRVLFVAAVIFGQFAHSVLVVGESLGVGFLLVAGFLQLSNVLPASTSFKHVDGKLEAIV